MSAAIEVLVDEHHVGDIVVEVRPGFRRAAMACT